ncbi:N-terminal half of MaoC dehydratase [Fictibacillus solisalsi]|uniref:N-terminal half of MaoC dehydratase n=1 Tax=Fictibacillus solisalsi TaxID=459525 RepID=A0A1G9VS13_9BACL|nr:MaoC family dehydratase N-terminal domain-containing protein [Fictibacillus solisalsi]SDM75052.1 N-terminal half of MaoC dehydratase [Fictibacillus solisalsi]
MRTKDHEIMFSSEKVQEFVQLTGERNPIYQSIDKAKEYGFKTIPLPPAMPNIVYQWIEIPWKLEHPVILRKQNCVLHQRMFIGERYRAVVKVTDQNKRQHHFFVQQTLCIYNRDGQLCFEGISDLIAGGLS